MRPALSIRIKLLLLALLASLPALGLALYSGLSEERVAMRAAENNAAQIVRDLTMRQQQLIASTRQFQATLALLPPVRGLDGEAAAPLFKSLLAANPIYSDIVLSDAQGRILASARTHPSSLNLSQAPFFPEVLKTASFTVGGYRKSITTGLDVLVCAHPVLDSRGKVLGVISTGLRLSISMTSPRASNCRRAPPWFWPIGTAPGSSTAISRPPGRTCIRWESPSR